MSVRVFLYNVSHYVFDNKPVGICIFNVSKKAVGYYAEIQVADC